MSILFKVTLTTLELQTKKSRNSVRFYSLTLPSNLLPGKVRKLTWRSREWSRKWTSPFQLFGSNRTCFWWEIKASTSRRRENTWLAKLEEAMRSSMSTFKRTIKNLRRILLSRWSRAVRACNLFAKRLSMVRRLAQSNQLLVQKSTRMRKEPLQSDSQSWEELLSTQLKSLLLPSAHAGPTTAVLHQLERVLPAPQNLLTGKILLQEERQQDQASRQSRRNPRSEHKSPRSSMSSSRENNRLSLSSRRIMRPENSILRTMTKIMMGTTEENMHTFTRISIE